MSFQACLTVILQNEGGFVDNPQDPGKATNLGVTIGTLSSWLGRPAMIDDVQALTPQTVAPIYEKWYWAPAGCAGCPAGVDMMVFDCAVNQGPGTAAKLLQCALGVPADGMVGPNTEAAAASCDAPTVIERLYDERLAAYRELPTWPTFGAGWTNRLNHTRAAALARVQ